MEDQAVVRARTPTLPPADCSNKRPATGTRPVERSTQIDVFNTTSWPRTELVILDEQMPVAGDKVTDAEHRVVASQRLERGQLAFVAADVPPFGAQTVLLHAGSAARGRNGPRSKAMCWPMTRFAWNSTRKPARSAVCGGKVLRRILSSQAAVA